MAPVRDVFAVLLLCHLCSGLALGARDTRPNVLFLMTDQQRHDVLGAVNPVALTPNLDKLAAQGVRMKHAYSSTPTCTPARAAILTGLSPWYHGMLGYGVVADRYPFEMPRALASLGYSASSIGKDHFGWNKTSHEGIPHGYASTNLYDGIPERIEFDNYDQWFATTDPGVNPMATGLQFNDYRGRPYALDEYYHPTAWVGRAAVNYLQQVDTSKGPFLLKASFHRPHSPYDPPKRVMGMYKPDDMPRPVVGDGWDTRFATHYNSTPSPGIWCGNLTWDVVKVSRQAYYGSVTFVDEWIGNIMATLEQRGLLNNTFVLFTADHGDALSDHYHWRKGYPYEMSSHVPMIVRWPESMNGSIKQPRGTTRDEVVELRDVFPTFLDVAGSSPGEHRMDGRSLLDLLRAGDADASVTQGSTGQEKAAGASGATTTPAWRQYVGLEHDICYNVTNHWSGLTDGYTKYIYRAYFADEQLFNLRNDPNELHDLAGDPAYAAELAKWRARLVAQFKSEQRGPDWLTPEGQLKRRVEGQLYSPFYPGNPRCPIDLPEHLR